MWNKLALLLALFIVVAVTGDKWVGRLYFGGLDTECGSYYSAYDVKPADCHAITADDSVYQYTDCDSRMTYTCTSSDCTTGCTGALEVTGSWNICISNNGKLYKDICQTGLPNGGAGFVNEYYSKGCNGSLLRREWVSEQPCNNFIYGPDVQSFWFTCENGQVNKGNSYSKLGCPINGDTPTDFMLHLDQTRKLYM